jgi:hypothetical protein
MAQTKDTALLLDFQVGIGDQPYAKNAAQRAAAALKAGRVAGLPVAFSRVKFRAGYRDVADSNKGFALIKMKNLFPPDESKLVSILQPEHDEIVVDKDGSAPSAAMTEGGPALGRHQASGDGGSGNQRRHPIDIYAGDEDYSITILSNVLIPRQVCMRS